MPQPDICTEAEVAMLVNTFYAKVRADGELAPIFDAHVSDWDLHLGKMVDFWSSALRGTARYRGGPMPKHVALPGLSLELFQQWLKLFRDTTAEMGNSALEARADDLAQRVAQSLWYGYQMYRDPDRLAAREVDHA